MLRSRTRTGGVSRLKTYRSRRSGGRIFGYLLTTLMVFAGLALIGYSFLMGDPLATAAIFGKDAPESGDLTLTVPEMGRVENVPVYTGPANDEGALHDGTLHIDSTGFPWQQGSNVYIAGHRMGFPGTKSFLVFNDLNSLADGDQVILKDVEGTRYTYTVFKKFIVNPDALYVTEPVPGRSVVSLQTCTLPDYSQRLIVQAELTSVA
jgi:sortase A